MGEAEKERVPEISIIMGIYNCQKYLKESIESIINQSFEDWELIMCDDASQDNTYLIAKEYATRYSDKIVLLKNDRNQGLNYTLNKCYEKARGKYIARQDGDDISAKERLETEYNFLKKNDEYALVSCNMRYFDEKGTFGESKHEKVPGRYDFLKESPFCHAPVLMRREAFEKVGLYTVNDRLLRVEDYHLWFKMYAAGYRGYNIQQSLYYMRDDRDAYKRRDWKNRLNEFNVRISGYRMLHLPWYTFFWAFKPILIGALPFGLYKALHCAKLKI